MNCRQKKSRVRRVRKMTNAWVEKITMMNTLPDNEYELFLTYEDELDVYEAIIDNIYAEFCELFEDPLANQNMIVDIFRSLDGIVPFDYIVSVPRNSPESIRELTDSADFPHMNRFISEYYLLIDQVLIPQTVRKFNDIALAFVDSPLSGDNVCEILSFIRSDTELISQHEIDCIVYSRL
jgi:hypothetical protein